MKRFKIPASFLLLLISINACFAQQKTTPKKCTVLAYYTGDSAQIEKYDISALTHIIFSFTHLQGNRLHVDKAKDSVTIRKLVSLKKKYPGLKIIFSMGGWGGCKECSAVFNTPEGRKEFALSSKQLLQYFDADGLDLDWEYPTIEGYPGHQFLLQDKQNFTALIEELHKAFGDKYELSFAAGGFTSYLLQSVEWDKIMPLLTRVNLMTYDLVSGFATTSGHATPLYATAQGKQSIGNAVHLLDSLHVPLNKLVAGAAFYARVFEVQDTLNHGLYRPCKFIHSVDYNHFDTELLSNKDFQYYWDSTAHAPYLFNAKERLFVTYDDKRSIKNKTQYVLDNGLDGIMFWELTNDVYSNGLLQAISEVAGKAKQ